MSGWRAGCTAVAVAAVLAVGAAGCANGGDGGPELNPDGPLLTGEDGDTWCIPRFEPASGAVHGSELLKNDSDDELVIESVELVDPNGFTLEGAYAMTLPVSTSLVGNVIGWPPGPEFTLTELATVAPNTEFNLVAHVTSTASGDEAALAGVRIEYSVEDGGRYVAETPSVLEWKETC